MQPISSAHAWMKPWRYVKPLRKIRERCSACTDMHSLLMMKVCLSISFCAMRVRDPSRHYWAFRDGVCCGSHFIYAGTSRRSRGRNLCLSPLPSRGGARSPEARHWQAADRRGFQDLDGRLERVLFSCLAIQISIGDLDSSLQADFGYNPPFPSSREDLGRLDGC